MSSARVFFFYGTLIAGSANAAACGVHPFLEPLGPAMTLGRLHAVPDPAGWYPALVAGGDRVSGQAYETGRGFSDAALALLDGWEDFDPRCPGESLYVRRATPIKLSDAREIVAHAYWFNQPLPQGAVAIGSGDFAGWLAKNGGSAYV